MTRSRGRISDFDLAFLENVRAGACGIVTDVKALAYWIDDPEQLAITLRILEKAQRIREATLEVERGLKEAARDERGG